MIYSPKLFQTSDEQSLALVRDFPFATVIAPTTMSISHLPLLVEGDKLIGHMARANSQWRSFAENPAALAIFNGPHAYISPSWYSSGRDVPTWNYCVVHAHGKVKLIEDFEGLQQVLQKISTRFEAPLPEPWKFELPADLLTPDTLCKAIIAFEISIEKLEGKFKLSQNRPLMDKMGVIEGLATRPDENSKQISALMREGIHQSAL